jgi:hypothetical protein
MSARHLALLLLAGCTQTGICDLNKVAQVPLQSPRIGLPVTVDGHTLNMALDTGGAVTLLFKDAVERYAIPRDYTTGIRHGVIGLSGQWFDYGVSIKSMSIGGAPVTVPDYVNVSDGKMAYDGLIGMDVLRHYDLDIDFPSRTLTLYHACSHGAPPWQPATAIPVESTYTGKLLAPFSIDGVQGLADVDTGSGRTGIMPQMVSKLDLTPQAFASDPTIDFHAATSATTKVYVHKFQTVQLGPLVLHDAPVTILNAQPQNNLARTTQRFPDGLVGLDFLGNRHFWFSSTAGQLFTAGP